MTTDRITVEELQVRLVELLAEHPRLAGWQPSCTTCSSMWCAQNTDGLTGEQRHAVRELHTILTGLGRSWPAGGCGVNGHQLERVEGPDGERIVCGRGDLDVPRPAGSRQLRDAYRVWTGERGHLHLEGVDDATDG